MYAILNPSQAAAPAIDTNPLAVWRAGQACIAKLFATTSDAAHGRAGGLFWAASGVIHPQAQATRVAPAAFAKAASCDPEDASQRYWGRYLVILYHEPQRRFLVLCDPCGQHPTFHHLAGDGALHIGDRIEDFAALGGVAGVPDADFLRHYLVHGYGAPDATGWAGISVLPPGQALTWQPGSVPEMRRAWSPRRVRSAYEPLQFVETLAMVLGAMLDDSPAIVLELSGGLDSTALAVASQRAGLTGKMQAVTYVDTKRLASDEGAMARQVATHCGIKHVTRSLLRHLPFSPVTRPPVVARPVTKLCFLAHNEALSCECIESSGADLLNGNGGDAIHLSFPRFGILIDMLARLRADLALTVMWRLAVFHRVPVWTVLSRAMQETVDIDADAPADRAAGFLVAGLSGAAPPALYADVVQQAGMRLQPGRRGQIAALGAMLCEALVQPYPAARRPVMPFLSQPVVEQALAMRLEALFSADYSRLLVRQQVFQAAHLSNLWRRDKGDVMHAALTGVRVNRDHVHETCLCGWVASQGWLDRRRLERTIRRLELGYSDGLGDVARVYAIEQFILGLSGWRAGAVVASAPGDH
ncbi:asparagine synthase-related protein [Chitinasiproducens palmae]|uniref:asparagine synthase (glutamine-hydrolyzing) n=1 Tax=Chitinasiproducens palmae TaxID=1770053 RepID=A0A1H2PWC9_9BURK|nr:asparagine synthase-related protein [Chitinasiproducens palmae]SDV51654.1 Asparagine synthase [Chitinasiproducens palmae]